jgi:ribosome maturation factor RimP
MVASSPQFAAFTEMLQPSIEAMGYDIVQVRLVDNYGRQTLQVMAERLD